MTKIKVSYLWPEALEYFLRSSLRRDVSLSAANLETPMTDSTHSLYLRRIALQKVTMTPLSISCMGSRRYIKLTQKCGMSQKALNKRCAPAFFR